MTKLTCIKDPGHDLSHSESGVVSVRDRRVRTEDEEMIMPQWFKPGIIGAVVGAIALAIVGFTSLGWVSANTAESMALKYANAAVVNFRLGSGTDLRRHHQEGLLLGVKRTQSAR